MIRGHTWQVACVVVFTRCRRQTPPLQSTHRRRLFTFGDEAPVIVPLDWRAPAHSGLIGLLHNGASIWTGNAAAYLPTARPAARWLRESSTWDADMLSSGRRPSHRRPWRQSREFTSYNDVNDPRRRAPAAAWDRVTWCDNESRSYSISVKLPSGQITHASEAAAALVDHNDLYRDHLLRRRYTSTCWARRSHWHCKTDIDFCTEKHVLCRCRICTPSQEASKAQQLNLTSSKSVPVYIPSNKLHRVLITTSRKVANAMHCNVNATRRRASCSGLFFWPNLYCACQETVTYELPVKILTSPLDSATPIS